MKKISYPEIRIENAWLLYQNASVHLFKVFGKGRKLTSLKDVDKKVKDYQKAWGKYEPKILKGFSKITGLEFKHNIIDVHIAPYFNAFSLPMVIGVKFEPDYFVDILTHELSHRLLTDNTKTNKINLIQEWEKLFGKTHSWNTLVHIPVHAIHQAIVTDILKQPHRVERDIERMREIKAKEYLASWYYVQKHGYKNIIQKLRKLYRIK